MCTECTVGTSRQPALRRLRHATPATFRIRPRTPVIFRVINATDTLVAHRNFIDII